MSNQIEVTIRTTSGDTRKFITSRCIISAHDDVKGGDHHIISGKGSGGDWLAMLATSVESISAAVGMPPQHVLTAVGLGLEKEVQKQ